jgi:hypothetical protein
MFEWQYCASHLPAAAVAFYPPDPVVLFLASMPVMHLGHPARTRYPLADVFDDYSRHNRTENGALGFGPISYAVIPKPE